MIFKNIPLKIEPSILPLVFKEVQNYMLLILIQIFAKLFLVFFILFQKKIKLCFLSSLNSVYHESIIFI